MIRRGSNRRSHFVNVTANEQRVVLAHSYGSLHLCQVYSAITEAENYAQTSSVIHRIAWNVLLCMLTLGLLRGLSLQ